MILKISVSQERGVLPQLNKDIYKKPTSNIIFTIEKLNAFSHKDYDQGRIFISAP